MANVNNMLLKYGSFHRCQLQSRQFNALMHDGTGAATILFKDHVTAERNRISYRD